VYHKDVNTVPFERWYQAIGRRRSRRRFDGKPLPEEGEKRLAAMCAEFRPFPDARAEFISRSADLVLKGAVGTYGKVKGARAFIALVGNMESVHAQERAGYTGEGIVLEAVAMGLDTCWVAGLFRRDVAARLADIHDREQVLAVVPVGHAPHDWSLEERLMTGFGRTHKRKPAEALLLCAEDEQVSSWLGAAIEAARLAPSAVNRQPWRFRGSDEALTVSVDDTKLLHTISKRLDCGIAMLHIELAAFHAGVRGQWEFLENPDVATFRKI
jgi:nitroreductase